MYSDWKWDLELLDRFSFETDRSRIDFLEIWFLRGNSKASLSTQELEAFGFRETGFDLKVGFVKQLKRYMFENKFQVVRSGF